MSLLNKLENRLKEIFLDTSFGKALFLADMHIQTADRLAAQDKAIASLQENVQGTQPALK